MLGNLYRKIFGRKSEEESEHCVIVYFKYGKATLEPLHDLEHRLRMVLLDSRTGDYDGHDIAIDLSDGMLYMYGSNAEDVFKTVLPVLRSADFIKGSKAKLRFGPPKEGVHEYFVDPVY